MTDHRLSSIVKHRTKLIGLGLFVRTPDGKTRSENGQHSAEGFMGDDRRGCLEGLLELTLLTIAFQWLEDRFGFGRGCSCSGCGCGCLLLILFILLACSIIFATDWTRLEIINALP